MKSEQGFSGIELLVVFLIMSIMTGIAAYNLRELDNPLEDARAELRGFFKQVRSRAISTTSAYEVIPLTTKQIITRYSIRCSDASKTNDPQLTLTLPTHTNLINTDWAVCFNARGLPDQNLLINLVDIQSQSSSIEVMLGGAIKEHK